MHSINKEKIIPYLSEDMYNLVADIASYPEFVPYCNDSGIIISDKSEVTAFIELSFQGINKKLTTKNLLTPIAKIEMNLVSGPVQNLVGIWQFIPINDNSTKIKLAVNYQFANPLYQSLATAVVDKVSEQILQSFIKRAKYLYE